MTMSLIEAGLKNHEQRIEKLAGRVLALEKSLVSPSPASCSPMYEEGYNAGWWAHKRGEGYRVYPQDPELPHA